jgi:hypothetical protein
LAGAPPVRTAPQAARIVVPLPQPSCC